MDRYGSDKPDTRFGLELKDVSDIAKASDFKVFLQAVELGGQVKGFAAPGMAGLSRKEVDDLTNEAKVFGAKGLAWIKVTEAASSRPSRSSSRTARSRRLADPSRRQSRATS